MSNDNLAQLAKLARLINTDKILTPDDIQKVVTALAAVLANNKKSTEALNADTKGTIQKALASVNEQLARFRVEHSDILAKSEKLTDAKVNQAIQQANTLIAQAKAAMPKDGLNPDPADVVPLVLQQIRLPENKQFILTGEDILNALNELPDEEDFRIDAKRIKNLPKLPKFLGGGAAVRPRMLNHDLTPQCNGITKVFNTPLNFGIMGVFSTQAPMIYRPGVDWTQTDRLLTLTSQVDPPQTGQTLWIAFIR